MNENAQHKIEETIITSLTKNGGQTATELHSVCIRKMQQQMDGTGKVRYIGDIVKALSNLVRSGVITADFTNGKLTHTIK